MLRKILLLLIKYIPVVQTAGMLLNNILYIFNKYTTICFILDFILGNSFSMFIVFLVCSYVFKFCNWYRTLVIGNFINILLSYILYIFYYNEDTFIIQFASITITMVTVLITMYFKFCRHEENINKVVSSGAS